MVVLLPIRTLGLAVCFALIFTGCSDSGIDRTVVASSQFPTAIDPSGVGTYPALTKSGAGYFYDDVLEYRVWVHPKGGGDDHFAAFASYEPALAYAQNTEGAEQPLVLVRQKQWINEPEPGKFEVRSDERITEWHVGWLLESTKRTENSIDQFMRQMGKAAN